jgi:mannose-6-phosphate isomerase-like protein (cupin superfamily)
MGFTVIRGDALDFGHPSWRPEDTTRAIVEVSRLAPLKHSRANLWRYPPGATGRRHIQFVQEEVFVVLEGTLTMLLGEPPERHEVPPHSIIVVEANTPLKVMNDSPNDLLFFVYGAPSDPSAEILEDVPDHVKKVIGPEDIPA